MYDVCVVYLLRDRPVDGRTVTEVLLGEKLTGLGVGKLVGAGGKLEPGESARAAAVREVAEELGVVVAASDLVAISDITYPFVDKEEWSQRSFGFVTRTWTGTPTGSDELAPHWYPVDAIPFDRMWADACLWLPRALDGDFVDATYSFRADGSMVAPS